MLAQTETLLADVARIVSSVDQNALRTTVRELGAAFAGTGGDLQQIIDTGNSFIEPANANFDVTAALIRDSNTVLRGQVDSASSLETFASELRTFTRSMAGADDDLRRVIDGGSYTANQLRTFLEQNQDDVSELLQNVITTGRVVVANLPAVRQALIAYPVVLEGSFAVVSKSPQTGLYDTYTGLVLTPSTPCFDGYEGTDTRGRRTWSRGTSISTRVAPSQPRRATRAATRTSRASALMSTESRTPPRAGSRRSTRGQVRSDGEPPRLHPAARAGRRPTSVRTHGSGCSSSPC